MSVDGIYAAYLAGIAGQGMGMFVFFKGTIAGADAAGLTFSGSYETQNDRIIGELSYRMPANSISITGAEFNEPSGEIKVAIDLPTVLEDDETHRIETPIGPINAKFTRVSSL